MKHKVEFHFFQIITEVERHALAEQVVPFVQENFNPMPRAERKKGKSFFIEIEPFFLRIKCKTSKPIEIIEMKEDEFFKEVDRLTGRWN